MTGAKVEITAELLNGVAEKLDGLALNDSERAVLDAILARAAAAPEDEVSGFWGGDTVVRSLENATIRPGGQKVGLAIGVFTDDTVARLNVILERGMRPIPGDR